LSLFLNAVVLNNVVVVFLQRLIFVNFAKKFINFLGVCYLLSYEIELLFFDIFDIFVLVVGRKIAFSEQLEVKIEMLLLRNCLKVRSNRKRKSILLRTQISSEILDKMKNSLSFFFCSKG
jgi:hypothetical protein